MMGGTTDTYRPNEHELADSISRLTQTGGMPLPPARQRVPIEFGVVKAVERTGIMDRAAVHNAEWISTGGASSLWDDDDAEDDDLFAQARASTSARPSLFDDYDDDDDAGFDGVDAELMKAITCSSCYALAEGLTESACACKRVFCGECAAEAAEQRRPCVYCEEELVLGRNAGGDRIVTLMRSMLRPCPACDAHVIPSLLPSHLSVCTATAPCPLDCGAVLRASPAAARAHSSACPAAPVTCDFGCHLTAAELPGHSAAAAPAHVATLLDSVATLTARVRALEDVNAVQQQRLVDHIDDTAATAGSTRRPAIAWRKGAKLVCVQPAIRSACVAVSSASVAAIALYSAPVMATVLLFLLAGLAASTAHAPSVDPAFGRAAIRRWRTATTAAILLATGLSLRSAVPIHILAQIAVSLAAHAMRSNRLAPANALLAAAAASAKTASRDVLRSLPWTVVWFNVALISLWIL